MKESVDGCGEESPKEALFPNRLLQSPKNIRVEHGYDAEVTEITVNNGIRQFSSAQVESAFAVIQWENTIMDEFEGLATQFNSWVPDFDLDLDTLTNAPTATPTRPPITESKPRITTLSTIRNKTGKSITTFELVRTFMTPPTPRS